MSTFIPTRNSWGATAATGEWRGIVHCKRTRCHRSYTFPLTTEDPGQRPWGYSKDDPQMRDWQAKHDTRAREVRNHPTPADWFVVVVNDTMREYCSVRCIRLDEPELNARRGTNP